MSTFATPSLRSSEPISRKIRVVVCDDHAVVRSGLKLLIEMTDDLEVVGEASDFPEAERIIQETQPDVATIDLSMPNGSGIEFVRKVAQRWPMTRSVVLTMHESEAFFRAAVTAGASGYVLKKSADVDFLAAIRSVASGGFFVSFGPSGILPSLSQQNETNDADLLMDLSARELEVLRMIALGLTNQEIADRLFLSVKTIESYRSRLCRKKKLRNRAELVQLAIRAGILQLGAP